MSERLDIVGRAGRRESGVVTDHRRTLGQAAEAEAARALQRAGLAVVERNVRFPEGEIDLVCRDDEVVVFVEVKCRRAGWDDSPAAAVSWRKHDASPAWPSTTSSGDGSTAYAAASTSCRSPSTRAARSTSATCARHSTRPAANVAGQSDPTTTRS